MGKLSFLYNDYELILQHSNALLPGVKKLVAIYHEPSRNGLQCKVKSGQGKDNAIETIALNDDQAYFSQSRLGNNPYQWLSRDDLPFEITDKSRNRDIFAEVNNVVLLLKFTNAYDKLKDLLFVYYPPNLGSFSLTRADKPISTDNKSIIASLLHHSLNTLISISRSDRRIFNAITKNNDSIIRDAETYKSELSRTSANYSESLISLCYKYLQEYSKRNSRNYKLSDDAVAKLKSFNGNINYLEVIIRNTIRYVENMNGREHNDEILINEWQINLHDYQAQQVSEETPYLIDDRYSKTMALLDKLENAAKSVIGQNNKLTSSNVGRACPQPISAPAITDALKKHKNKILQLFDKYPDKWYILRQRFKPVINLYLKKDPFEEKSA